jgi:ribulose-phosphate 3-epimerase
LRTLPESSKLTRIVNYSMMKSLVNVDGADPLHRMLSFCYHDFMADRPLVAPSILSADFGHLAAAVKLVEKGGGDWVHLDVMDGVYVPNITFGPVMVAALRPHSSLPFDTHLMIVHPENYIGKFADAGSDSITIHFESTTHVHRVLREIKELGKKAGVSIVPSTPADLLSEVLPDVDLILVMTVNPGFGGQELIPRTLDKVRYLAELRARDGYRYLIEVDGGINRQTCKLAIEAGADVLVVGSAIFDSKHPEKEIAALRCR